MSRHFQIDNSQNCYVLVFDFTSKQETTQNFHSSEPVGELPELQQKFYFPLEHGGELTVLGEPMSSAAADDLGFDFERTFKVANVAF